jgi:hypothetical protein
MDTPQTPGVNLGLLANDTCICVIDHKECYVLRKLQRVLSATETWCECWNIKINEDKTQTIYFTHTLRPPEAYLTLNKQSIPFVNHVKDLSVIFNKRITWRLHIEMTEAKACRIFIRISSLLKNEHLSTNIKLMIHKLLIRSMPCLPCLGICSRHLPLKIAVPAKQDPPHHWKFSKVHTNPTFANSFQPSACIQPYNKAV